jgi:hypothetical protein
MKCSSFLQKSSPLSQGKSNPLQSMPVILTTTEEFDLWLEGETVEALTDLSCQWIDRVHARRPPAGRR